MPNAAETQAEALADVERIARALYELVREPLDWESVVERHRETWRGYVRELLSRDLIRVGRRPNVERALEGQTELADFIEGLER